MLTVYSCFYSATTDVCSQYLVVVFCCSRFGHLSILLFYYYIKLCVACIVYDTFLVFRSLRQKKCIRIILWRIVFWFSSIMFKPCSRLLSSLLLHVIITTCVGQFFMPESRPENLFTLNSVVKAQTQTTNKVQHTRQFCCWHQQQIESTTKSQYLEKSQHNQFTQCCGKVGEFTAKRCACDFRVEVSDICMQINN